MSDGRFDKYNEKRQEIILQYRKKSIIQVSTTLLAGLATLIIIVLLRSFLNIALTLVLSAMVIMTAIIFARIQAVTINHTLQSRLRLFEQEEPEFHANFKK